MPLQAAAHKTKYPFSRRISLVELFACFLFFPSLSFDVSICTDLRPQRCMFFDSSINSIFTNICSTLESLGVVLRLLSSSLACSTVFYKSSFNPLSSLLILNMPISFLVSSKAATYLRQTLLSSKATRVICIFKFVMTSHLVECFVPLSTTQLGS